MNTMPTIQELLDQGWKTQQAGQARAAEQIYLQVLAAEPKDANAWCFLGMALHEQERYDDALAAYHKAMELQPDFPIALNNLGNTYRLMRRLPDAVKTFDRAIALKPDYLIAYKNKATTLCWEGQVEPALRVYEAAEKIAPDDPDIHKHLGIMSLLLGDFARGWPEYEWRWKTGEVKLPVTDIPNWDGTSLDGKTIVLTPEQGLGDTIQFIRYAAWLKEKYKCRVLFHFPKSLRQLLSSVAGIDEWVSTLKEVTSADWYAPLLFIPSVLGHQPKDFPQRVPYVTADEKLAEQWRQR